MMMIVEKENVSLLINRNPTLNYYSMLLLKVRKVKRSGTDYCLSVPLSILPGLNAPGSGCFKTYLTCGEVLLMCYYVLIAAMYMRARSNVQGIVTM